MRGIYKKAYFICMKCDLEYDGPPGPTECPKCQSKYVRWVNFDDPDLSPGARLGSESKHD